MRKKNTNVLCPPAARRLLSEPATAIVTGRSVTFFPSFDSSFLFVLSVQRYSLCNHHLYFCYGTTRTEDIIIPS